MLNKITQAIFHITYVCTHHCPMCYANAGIKSSHPPLKQLCLIVDRLLELGITDLTLVGGDPASYPYIASLACHIKKAGMHLTILSNTLDFSPSKESVLDYIDVYEGTIHHSIKEKHDQFCGSSGAYESLLGNLKFFSSLHKRTGLAVNMIPYNYDAIYDLIMNVISHDVSIDHLVLQRIIQFGRAVGSVQYELDKRMLNIIMRQVEQAEKEFGLSIIFEDPLPLCSIDEKYHKYMHPCEWGITKVSVDYNGNLSRCGADVFHSFGSIFDEDVLEKWNTSSLLLEFRNKTYLPQKCRNCLAFDNCGGGCPISREPDRGFSLDYLAL